MTAGLLTPSSPTWSYEDRRTCQEIVEGIWLGPHMCGKDAALLYEIKISDIILVRAGEGAERLILKPRPEIDWIAYHEIEMSDTSVDSSINLFASTSELLIRLRAAGSRVLVLGASGMSRSASLVAAYLMKEFGLSLEQTCEYLMSRRRCVSISEPLKRQLREFQVIIPTLGASSQSRPKRQLDEGPEIQIQSAA